MTLPQRQEQIDPTLPPAPPRTGPANKSLGSLYLAVTGMFARRDTQFTAQERILAADILRRLSTDVDLVIRVTLAERIATRTDAPHELALLLAEDCIEVARPLLTLSPVLNDDDLLRLADGANEHQIAIAERCGIVEAVSAVLASSPSDAVVIALLRNCSAKIDSDTFGVLVERARHAGALHRPLAERGDLPANLAARMYSWASPSLKAKLIEQYPQTATLLSSTTQSKSENTPAKAPPQPPRPLDPDASAAKIVDKLAASAQLRPSFPIRALYLGRIELFEHGFAKLLTVEVEAARRFIYGEPLSWLALACRAAGIDRAVFATIFNLSRRHHAIQRPLTEHDREEIKEIFSTISQNAALMQLMQAAMAWKKGA